MSNEDSIDEVQPLDDTCLISVVVLDNLDGFGMVGRVRSWTATLGNHAREARIISRSEVWETIELRDESEIML